MNKDAICELMDLRADISTINPLPNIMKPVINKLNSIIIDLMDEGRESGTCCACKDCPAMKKVDELDSQAEMFKKLIAAVTADEILEAEKMARGKRARGGADR